MQTLDIRRDKALAGPVRDELTRLAADLERQWPQLPPPVVLPWSDHPVVALDRGTPWLYGPADRDPLRGRNGEAIVPRRQRRELARIAATRTRFDAVAVAHELDAHGPVRELLPLLQDGPRTCTHEVARALVGPVPAHPTVTRVAGALGRMVGGLGSAAWAGGVLDLLLDPIVLGVVGPYGLAHGTPAVFQPLTAWRW
jgi:hypothetical protein